MIQCSELRSLELLDSLYFVEERQLLLRCEQVIEVVYDGCDHWVTDRSPLRGRWLGLSFAAAMTWGIGLRLRLKSCASRGNVPVFQVVLVFELLDCGISLFFELSQPGELVCVHAL